MLAMMFGKWEGKVTGLGPYARDNLTIDNISGIHCDTLIDQSLHENRIAELANFE